MWLASQLIARQATTSIHPLTDAKDNFTETLIRFFANILDGKRLPYTYSAGVCRYQYNTGRQRQCAELQDALVWRILLL